MLVCPVDTEACQRATCRRGVCELSGSAPLRPCSECGALETGGLTIGVCLACVQAGDLPAAAELI
jgi:hypothetical protein